MLVLEQMELVDYGCNQLELAVSYSIRFLAVRY